MRDRRESNNCRTYDHNFFSLSRGHSVELAG